MFIGTQVVRYYVEVTGNDWESFYNKLDKALKEENPTGDLFIIKRLMGFLTKQGITISEFLKKKDIVKSEFNDSDRREKGEFYTPEDWCSYARGYFDTYIENWREYNVWDASCGTGNLMRSAGHNPAKLFLSTLVEEDVELVRKSKEYEGAIVFQCDFLKGLSIDKENDFFLEKLPKKLQEIIREDKPLIIFMNPPYSALYDATTDVGKIMVEKGFSKASYDLFYQFCFRVKEIIELYRLKNCYLGIFSPVQLFTGLNGLRVVGEMHKCMSYIDGFYFPATEFQGISSSITWGIAFTLWKSNGEYRSQKQLEPMIMVEKQKNSKGEIIDKGKKVFGENINRLSLWMKPRDELLYYEKVPVMTSYSTFKGAEKGEKKALVSNKMVADGLGCIMSEDRFSRLRLYFSYFSTPTSIHYTVITQENFWRCVGAYTYRSVYRVSWCSSRGFVKAPDESSNEYQLWLKNALVLFLFDYKSMASSHRGISFGGFDDYVIKNKFFPVSKGEILERCRDEKILEDLENNPLENDFVLEQIELVKHYWVDEVRELYYWCKEQLLESYNKRKEISYADSMECVDASFIQLRNTGLWNETLEKEYFEKITRVKEYLRRNVHNLGFE